MLERNPVSAKAAVLTKAADATTPAQSQSSVSGGRQYKVFISYSHASDHKLAAALESALEKLGKPWHRRRNFNVFRDATGLAINPGIWSAIEAALGESEFVVVLASPEAAQSPWVRKEIDYWLGALRRNPNNLLLAVTGGELVWDDSAQDFDWTRTTALPAEFSRYFRGRPEPLWADFIAAKAADSISLNHTAFRRPAVKIAARLMDTSPGDLDCEDLRQHHRTIRTFQALAGGLVVILLAALAFLWYAIRQRNIAIDQRNTAVARQLTGEVTLAMSSEIDPSLAALLAIESVGLKETSEGREALARANAHLLRPIWQSAFMPELHEVAFSPDRRLVAISAWDTPRQAGFNAVFDTRTGRQLSKIPGGGLALAFSPDGRLLAANAFGKSVSLFESNTGRETVRFAYTEEVHRVAFSPDGRELMVAWGLDKLSLRDLSDGHETALRGIDWVMQPVFSPDSSMLLTGAPDYRTFRVLDARTGRELSRHAHRDALFGGVFSPDSRYVLSGSQDQTAHVFEARSGRELFRIQHQGSVGAFAFSPNGSLIATGGFDGLLRVSEMPSGSEVSRAMNQGRLSSVMFDSTGSEVATGSDDQSARLIEARTGRELARIQSKGWVDAVSFDATGDSLITAARGGLLSAFEAHNTQSTALFAHSSEVYQSVLHPGKMLLATTSSDKIVRVFDVHSGKELARADHRWPIISLAMSDDGRWVASGSEDMTAAILDLAKGGEPARIWHPEMPISITFSPDSRLLVTGARDSIARVYDVQTRRLLARLAHPDRVCGLAFSPDGKALASGSYDGNARLFDVQTWREAGKYSAGKIICDVAFTNDGKELIIQQDDKARFVDLASKREVAAVSGRVYDSSTDGRAAVQVSEMSTEVIQLPGGHRISTIGSSSPVVSSSLTADGRLLAFATADQLIHIVEVDTGREIALFQSDGPLRLMGFNSDGSILHTVTGHIDLRYEEHLARPNDLVKDSCTKLTRNLTTAEWQRYLGSMPYRKTCEQLSPVSGDH
jgi:WD40 repeat protein